MAHNKLPLAILLLFLWGPVCSLALPWPSLEKPRSLWNDISSKGRAFIESLKTRHEPTVTLEKRATNKTVWVSYQTYQGATFFDEWDFWDLTDPTNGLVDYVDRDTAFRNGLVYITPEGRANMHVDSWTTLTLDEVRSRSKLRPSVRLHSKTKYNHGLFILDVTQAPFGCGTWPAYWTSGFNWPGDGEIDIIENVHSSLSNQVAWHTNPGCFLTTPGNFTGTAGSTICDATVNYNTGCGIVDQSIASFGPTFNEKGGGVYVMKWDENSIDVWFFYRSAIPDDILDGLPNPANWPLPSASLSNKSCNIDQYFMNQMLIFDTTLCGDWAGTSYEATGCPGTCEERVTDPRSFVNATWSINYIKVYNKTVINTAYLEAAASPPLALCRLYAVLAASLLLIAGFLQG